MHITEKLCKYILDALLSKANSTFINRCRFKKIICSETLLTCLLLNLQGNFAHILNTTLIMIYIPTLFKYCKSPLGIQNIDDTQDLNCKITLILGNNKSIYFSPPCFGLEVKP